MVCTIDFVDLIHIWPYTSSYCCLNDFKEYFRKSFTIKKNKFIFMLTKTEYYILQQLRKKNQPLLYFQALAPTN